VREATGKTSIKEEARGRERRYWWRGGMN